MPENDPFAVLIPKKKKRPGVFGDVTGGGSSASTEAADPFAILIPKKKKPNRGAFLAPIASGLTLGASDEILGGIEGLSNLGKQGGFSEGYERGKAKVRGVGKDYAEAHPILSPALELAGGIAAPGFGAARFAAGKIGKSALAGAGLGAASGAAYGDEGKRTEGAIAGGAIGGVLGGGVTAGGKLIGGIANQLGWRSAKASEKIGVQKAIEALRRDKITPEMLGQTEADALSTNTPLRLFDMGGQNTSGLARAAQAVPSRARDELPDILHGRHAGQPERIFGQAEQAMGVKGRDLHDLTQEITQRAAAKAKPHYDAAYSHGPVESPALGELLNRPALKKALAKARQNAADEGVALPYSDVVDVQTLDYTKRALDDRISGLLRKGKKDEARILVKARKEMLDVVDAEVPDFKTARSLFSGEKAHEKALQRGARAFGKPKLNEPPMEKWLARASDSEKEMFKVGTLGAIRDVLQSAGDNTDKVRRLLGSPKSRAAVQAVIGDLPKSAQFSKAMALESKAVQSKNFILGNSQTARILADMDDMTNTAIGMLGDAATGNVAGVARKGLGAFIGNRKKAGAGRIAESVNRTLQAQPGTPEFKALVEQLRGMKNTRKQFPFDRVVESGLRQLSPGRQ